MKKREAAKMTRISHPDQFSRQVHLDFHTSPLIPDVGCEFDAKAFARTLKQAHVTSVTVFAKCHHGMCYYPTKTGTQHPALRGRDLLGEQIEALHREGIRVPVYTTVVWEEDVAWKYPQWRQITYDGAIACPPGATGPDGKSGHKGMWKFNNFLDPDYQDYIEAHVREFVGAYDVDGVFLDIVFFAPGACWSDASRRFREKHGLTDRDAATQVRFESAAQVEFGRRFMRVIRGLKPDASVFFNASNHLFIDSGVGLRARDAVQTHWEIESLPSGFWGYHHFPRLARAVEGWSKPWVGQTGRFQKMWGDFGGIKPQPALEFECFRSQALGGACGVGDQLPPRGWLDAAAYRLIGGVFAQCAEAEPFYARSVPMPQVGICAAGYPGISMEQADQSVEGAVQMCDEAHYNSAVLDDASILDGFDLLILPDTVTITPRLLPKLQRYLDHGGKLIASFRSGMDAAGQWALRKHLPLTVLGEVELHPTYWRARRDFDEDLSISDRVFYQAGLNVKPGRGIRVLIDRVLPYFKRTDLTFSSHFQTPPVRRPDAHPAALSGKNFAYFADPIFREYRKSGNIAARDAWRKVAEDLIGPAAFGAGLPTSILLTPRRRGKDLILTLLHYIPQRKALEIDMIEERLSFGGELLRLPSKAKTAHTYPDGEPLKRDATGAFILPSVKGRLLLEVPGLFA
jgi:hypothetical protein